MKVWYDQKVGEHTFNVGTKVLVLLPIVGNPLQARYHDLYTIVLMMLSRKQRQLCHVNMLKEYRAEDGGSDDKSITSATDRNVHFKEDDDNLFDDSGIRLNNSQAISNLLSKLGHLSTFQVRPSQYFTGC